MYKILKIENGKKEIKEINKELEDLQREVGGNIELVYLQDLTTEDNIILVVNEENKLNGEELSLFINYKKINFIDTVHGEMFFIMDKEGNFESLTEEAIELLDKTIIKNRASQKFVLNLY